MPYGVLPAVDLANWRPAPLDPVFEEGVTVLVGSAVDAWATAASAGGTAVGADADQLLDVIGRVPTSRRLGSRAFVPLEIVALLQAAINGKDPAGTIDAWEAMAAPAFDHEPRPQRRYQPFGYVQPGVTGRGSIRELLGGYLDDLWENLANVRDEEKLDPPLLVRLIRHSLLLTQAEVSRLSPDEWPSWTRGYLLPLDNAQKLADDASRGGRVVDLPQYAQDLLDSQYPPNPDAAAIVRQFHDVRAAVRDCRPRDALMEGGALWPAVTAVIDTSSHRIDPWITGTGTRRLRRLIARDVPRRLGAYGWVDDLDPAVDPTPPTTAGLLHAPGNAQALAAAVLRDHADPRRRRPLADHCTVGPGAARGPLGGDVRVGVHISEALGREIERRAGDPAAVLELRRTLPRSARMGGPAGV